eukprot:UN01678
MKIGLTLTFSLPTGYNLKHHTLEMLYSYFIDIPYPQIFKIQQVHIFHQNKENLAWMNKV